MNSHKITDIPNHIRTIKIQSWVLMLLLGLTISCEQSNPNKASSDQDEQTTYVGPVIDMHIHAFSRESGSMMFGMRHPKTLRGQTFEGVETPEEQKTRTYEKFEKFNIVKAVVSGGELWHSTDPDRVLVGGSNLSIDQLRQKYHEGKLHVLGEMAPFYAGMKADDPSFKTLFDLAEELDIPVGFHIFPGGPPGGIYNLGMKEMRARNANPLQIEEVLVDHPDIRIYVMHGGWPYLEDMKALMYAHPQVYIDVATTNWILPKEEFHDYLEGLVNSGFGERIMFGSDQMVWPETIDIAIDAINTANFLTKKQKKDIFYDNAARFLGLREEEINRHNAK